MEKDIAAGQGAVVEIHAPAGFWGKVTGLTAHDFFLFIIVCMLGILMFMVDRSDTDRDKRYVGLQQQLIQNSTVDKRMLENQLTIMGALAGVSEEQKATTYVLTLSQARREALRLQEPKSIRDRQVR